MYELIGKQLGKYQIISLIGRGGMAELYKAYQPNMERYVALKILHTYIAEDPDSLERFKQEAKHIARLRHENILPVYDFGEDEGFPYLVMPFVENKSLADAMRGKRLSISQVCKIVFDIASALYYAHQHGIVHLDVKPSNILIDQQGHCDLIDFGLARIFQETPGNFFASSIMGTPAYMSPEQARGDQTDHRSDIYSLGIVLYEMATGRVPYEAETVAALLYMHIRGALPPPRVVNPALPESVERVILRSLAKDPSDRYATAGEMAQALSGILSTLPVRTTNDLIEKKRLNIFICHSSSDKPIVRKLYDQLKGENWLDPWLDEEKLLPGEDWNREISQAVKASDCIIVCLSHGSINKEGYVQKEISLALYAAQEKPEGTIYIIPLKLEECRVPWRLQEFHWVNYFEKGAHEKLILSLKKRAQNLGINTD